MFVEHLLHHRFCKAKPSPFKEVSFKFTNMHACIRSILFFVDVFLIVFFLLHFLDFLFIFTQLRSSRSGVGAAAKPQGENV